MSIYGVSWLQEERIAEEPRIIFLRGQVGHAGDFADRFLENYGGSV